MEDTSTLTALPDDPQALKQIIVDLSRQRDQFAHRCDDATRRCNALQQKHDELQVQKLRLEVELLRLKKWYYGRRADDLSSTGEVAQMLLGFAQQLESRPVDPQDLPADTATLSGDAKEDQVKTVRRIRRGRRNLAAFDQLPVTRCEHDLPQDQKPCPCCGEMRHKIGEDSSWQIEYIPGHFERIEHIRFKYACRQCEQNAVNPQITLAEKPSQPIDKGMAGPGLLAYIVTSKYSDYLPLYRLESIFERNGLQIDRGTQSLWCRDVAQILKPLYDLMVQRLLQSHLICTDDTVMPMLAPEKTKQARMWVYIGDEQHPYNVFDFTLGRGRDGPVQFLKGYGFDKLTGAKQTLLADAYGGYDGVVVSNDMIRAGCWAHARRKFVDAEKTHPAIAAEAVGIIRQLYAIEQQATLMNSGQTGDKSAADRLYLRQSQSQPLLAKLRDRLWTWKDELLPKHPMADAVNYALNQWNELSVFAGDGAVPIDNNISERDIKRIVLNRKNSLFVGNERAGQTAAILSSITSTCRRHAIDPQRYLTQLLTNLPDTPISQLPGWLPDAWTRANPALKTAGM